MSGLADHLTEHMGSLGQAEECPAELYEGREPEPVDELDEPEEEYSREEQVDALEDTYKLGLANLVAAIPNLRQTNVPKYIAAVNKAMLYGALAPQAGKAMLYGAQLFLAAIHAPTPAARPVQVSMSGRSKPDRRFREHREPPRLAATIDSQEGQQ